MFRTVVGNCFSRRSETCTILVLSKYATIAGNRHVEPNVRIESKASEETSQNLDSFTKEFIKNHIEVNTFQRLILSTGSSLAALINPLRFFITFQKRQKSKMFKLQTRYDCLSW